MPKEPSNPITEAPLAALIPEELPSKKLPNMNEFSPGTLGTDQVSEVLSLLKPFNGDKQKMLAAIVKKFPKINATTDGTQQLKRANNVLIGMSQCSLIEKNSAKAPVLTALATRLLALPAADAVTEFAKHLLLNAYGLELFDVVSMIRARGEAVSMQAIREELRTRGFTVTENEGNSAKIRQWLEPSGIVNEKWEVQDAELHRVTGITSHVLSVWNGLTYSQKIFANALLDQDRLTSAQWIPVRHLKKLCETSHGKSIFPEGKLREKIIVPLEASGLLEARGIGSGRGGDSGDVLATEALRSQRIELPLESMSDIPVELRGQLARPLAEIFRDLSDKNKHKRGVALELLAWRLATDIGLFPVCFRERSAKTQQAEVDLIANGINLQYSRWLIQCKNTETVEVSDIAKEVGMAVVLKAHVILMVTTGRFTKTVQTYANGLATTSALQAVLLDHSVLKKYQTQGGNAVIEWLRHNAFGVLALKKSQVTEVV